MKWKQVTYGVLWGIGVAVSLPIFLASLPLLIFSCGPTRTDTTDQWRTTFREEALDFQIPPEATLVSAEKRKDVLMGGGYIVVFRLPNTKQPVQWLEQIAAKSNGLLACRKSKLMFDCRDDIRRLEYIPDRNVFEAEYMWD